MAFHNLLPLNKTSKYNTRRWTENSFLLAFGKHWFCADTCQLSKIDEAATEAKLSKMYI